MVTINRRDFVTGALAAGTVTSLSLPVLSQSPTKFTIIGHRVLQQTATEGPAGDVTKEWATQNNAVLQWITLDTDAVRDRQMREAQLKNSEISVDFVHNSSAAPQIMDLFEPLEPYIAKAPIDNFEDLAPGMVRAFTIRGKIYGIPYRQSVNGLHYNETFLKERGLDRPPQVIEELLDYLRKLTYTRSDGNKVYGWGFQADNPTDVIRLAWALGGDFITDDYRCVADGDGMVKALALLRTMQVEGLIPPNMTAMKQNDLITAMQNGKIAMSYFPFGRTLLFNDSKSSKFPGAFKFALPLVSKDGFAKGEVIATTEFWSLMIPRNSKVKDLAWSFIRDLSSPSNTVKTAINGNGPVRSSAYSDPRLIESVPYAAMEAKALKAARVPMPAFDKAAEAKDIFVEEMQSALLGFKSPEDAGKSMTKRVQPLLPRI